MQQELINPFKTNGVNAQGLELNQKMEIGNLKIKSKGWNIEKSELGTVAYIEDKHSKNTLLCEIYPNAKNKNDLPSRNVYTKKDKSIKKTITQQKVNGSWADCYQVVDETYIQIGDNSTVFIYQEYSLIEYTDDNITTTLILKKWNGTAYNVEPKDIWIKNETECSGLNKSGLCFGAIDNSMNENELSNYSYTIETNSDLVLIENPVYENGTLIYTYPLFYTYQKTGEWKEERQEYNFRDICSKSYANCKWDSNNVYFTSDKYIDPTITNVSACGTLALNNTYYQLNQSITSTGTCLTVTGFNNTIDGNGYNLTYGTTSCAGCYGISATNIRNISIINLRINTSTFGNQEYAIFFNNVTNSLINNNTFDFHYSAIGLINNGINHTITNNNATQKTTANYVGTALSLNCGPSNFSCIIKNNTIYTRKLGALGVSIAYAEFSNNNITTEGLTAHGITYAINSSIHDNRITTLNNTSGSNYGYFSSNSAYNTIENNIFNVTNSDVWYIIGFRGNCATAIGTYTFINNTIIKGNSSKVDLGDRCTNNPIGLLLKNQKINSYYTNYRLSIEDTDYGRIDFLSAIHVMGNNGTNMSKQIQINNNSIYVNASVSGLNVSANISLYNLPEYNSGTGYINSTLLPICDSTTNPKCIALTSLDIGTPRRFNVSAWDGSPFGIWGTTGTAYCWTRTGTGRGSVLYIPRGCLYYIPRGQVGA